MPRSTADKTILHKKTVKKKAVVKVKKTAKKKSSKVLKQQNEEIRIEAALPASPALAPLTHGHSLYYPNIQFKPEHKSQHRKKQNLVIGLGVSVIMTVIVIAWILNLKKLIGPEVDAAAEQPTTNYSDLTELKNELTDTLSEVKGQLNELKNMSEEPATSTIAPETEEALRDAFKATVEKTVTETPTSSVSPTTLP